MMSRHPFSLLFLLWTIHSSSLLGGVLAFNNDAFSLAAYQKARALETSNSLDGSRLHFQILFVDDDNAKGRIAEGLMSRITEYNDALFVLFPASATIDSSRNAPRDAAAPEAALAACATLGLCDTIATAMGTSFNLSYLDEYDLVIALDDDIRSLILRSMPVEDQEYYGPKCRLLSEFLSPEFCSTTEFCTIENDQLLDMLEPDLRDRVEPITDLILDRSSNVFASSQSEEAEGALILGTAGLARFCLDTMDNQFETAFSSLLEKNFGKQEDLEDIQWEKADAQLRRCSYAITGYFSPQQRKRRFDRHVEDLLDKRKSAEE